MSAKERYDLLYGDRTQYLNVARRASELTLPYMIRDDEESYKSAKPLPSPWQSVGAKGVVTLAAKLMLAFFLHRLASSSYKWMRQCLVRNTDLVLNQNLI